MLTAITPRRLGALLKRRLEARRPTLLATLVERDGHGYRAPGAHLLIDPTDREGPVPIEGRISGGCLEEEVAARSRGLTAGALLVEIDTTDDGPYGLGLACGGRLTILVEAIPGDGADAVHWRAWARALEDGDEATRWLDADGTFGWTTASETARWSGRRTGPSDGLRKRMEETARVSLVPDVHARVRRVRSGWLERVPRPPRLIVVGTEDDGLAVARTMLFHGWTVELVGPSRDRLQASADRLAAVTGRRPELRRTDPDGLAPQGFDHDDRLLAASRRLDLDGAGLAAAVRSGVRWIGGVASRSRRDALVRSEPLAAALRDAPAAIDRIEMPVAADHPAHGAEEVATAVAARLTADLRAANRATWAVVPAAGASRRLGTGKPLLHDGHETLIERAERLAEAACDATVVVTGARAEEVEARLGAGTQVVRASDPGRGMRASLLDGIAAVPATARVLVLLPDMPGVEAGHLAALRRAATAAAGAASRSADGVIGPPAILPDDLVAALRSGAVPSEGDTGFAPWLRDRRDIGEVVLDDATDVDEAVTARALGWAPYPG